MNKKKSWLSLILTLCLILGLTATAFAAEDVATGVSMTVSSETVAPGEEVTVTVIANSAWDNVFSIEYYLGFDETLVEWTGIKSNVVDTEISAIARGGFNNQPTAYLDLNYFSYDFSNGVDVEAGAVLATLTFRALDTVDDGTKATFTLSGQGVLKSDGEGGYYNLADDVATEEEQASVAVITQEISVTIQEVAVEAIIYDTEGNKVSSGDFYDMMLEAGADYVVELQSDITITQEVVRNKNIIIRSNGEAHTIYMDYTTSYSLYFAKTCTAEIDGTNGEITLTQSLETKPYTSIYVAGELTLTQVKITGLANSKQYGAGATAGAINVVGTGNLILNDSSVTNCTSVGGYGQIYLSSTSSGAGSLTLKGTVQVEEVFLTHYSDSSYPVITLAGVLEDGSSIGVTLNASKGAKEGVQVLTGDGIKESVKYFTILNDYDTENDNAYWTIDNNGLLKEAKEAAYYAGIKEETAEITMGEKAYVTVYLNNEDVDSINSLMVEMTYDAEKLSITSEDITGLSNLAQVTIKEGIITIVDFGDDKEVGDLLTLAFTGIATGESKISLTYVGVDTSTGAVSTDLDEAVIKAATAVVTVTGYTVSLSDYFTADSLVVEPGEDFTFTAKDTHYNYTFATTMGGEEVEVVNNGDGTYTIKNVTGNLVIEATATAKTYAVTVTGNGSDDLTYEKTATYGVDYPFTLDAGEGYAYTVVATIDGEQVEAAQGEEGTYTIAGANVTGDIAIAVTKEKTTVQVTFTGTGSGDVMGGASQTAKIDEAFTFTIQEDGDYEYTVILGETELSKDENGSYTIVASYITGEDIVVTVTKTAVDTKEITVTEYIKLDKESIFLVKVTGSLEDGQVFAYDGVAMFTLDGNKEGAYYYLVISEGSIADVAEEAEEMVAAATATATAIVRDGDVNMTGVIDVNDAQLTYDIYNGLYTDFSIVSMEKFLRADVNGDGVVNVNDAVAALAKR